MSSKTKNLTREEQLLNARKEGLAKMHSLSSMKAHGKVLGMDTFSWQNPDIENLHKAIESFPFNIIWIGNNEHISKLLHQYPTSVKNLEWLIVYDRAEMIKDVKLIKSIKNIACIDDLEGGFEFFKSVKKSKTIFLFTYAEGGEKEYNKLFESFINI